MQKTKVYLEESHSILNKTIRNPSAVEGIILPGRGGRKIALRTGVVECHLAETTPIYFPESVPFNDRASLVLSSR